MPRPARDFQPGGHYHLVTRGVNGRAVYVDDDDRRRFLVLLSVAARSAGGACTPGAS
jgi:hypothetical protein